MPAVKEKTYPHFIGNQSQVTQAITSFRVLEGYIVPERLKQLNTEAIKQEVLEDQTSIPAGHSYLFIDDTGEVLVKLKTNQTLKDVWSTNPKARRASYLLVIKEDKSAKTPFQRIRLYTPRYQPDVFAQTLLEALLKKLELEKENLEEKMRILNSKIEELSAMQKVQCSS